MNSWIKGKCKKCGYEVVVTQPDEEKYPYSDYQWYCSNKKCYYHEQIQHTADTEKPHWVILEDGRGNMAIKMYIDKKDMIALIKGSHIPLELLYETPLKENASYSDQYGRVEWKREPFKNKGIEELFELYLKIKNYKADDTNE